ncbi:hypothetical protein [Bradyrhizobium sp. 191]|uniref:hypothetical protein n=1 Tax=Bradyrhizobium sp. 191 TaxID=2782659 RepID=UPI001FFF7799|nr:hypothetical protein [Bradyrhizobium sp. 191]UPJ67939.1 hypothetical protein IVB23_11480 [Bradyrhizobium sp. 191]
MNQFTTSSRISGSVLLMLTTAKQRSVTRPGDKWWNTGNQARAVNVASRCSKIVRFGRKSEMFNRIVFHGYAIRTRVSLSVIVSLLSLAKQNPCSRRRCRRHDVGRNVEDGMRPSLVRLLAATIGLAVGIALIAGKPPADGHHKGLRHAHFVAN